ncbi:MAG: hypothetical protein L0Z62_38675 [Gemmataceae bacterium]|nr:hypothetical protein [Gemmataceae bacterium]
MSTNEGKIANGIAGDPLKAEGGGAIQVLVQDAFGNTATDFNGPVWVGVNRAAPNSETTPIGDHFDPTGQSFGVYVKVNAGKGVATFANLFINRASTKYQLAVGSPEFALGTDTSKEFNLDIGAAAKVAFLVQPDRNGVGAYQRITGDGNQIIVAVQDKVGNVVVKDSGRDITMQLATNPDPSNAHLKGRTTIKTQNSIAIFDLLCITATNNATIPDFQLQASADGLGDTLLSDKFPLNASPGGVGRTVPLPDFTVVSPPGNVKVNEPLRSRSG